MKTEKTLALIFLLALGLRMFNIPGSSILLVLVLSMMSLIYFPFAFYFFSYRNIKTQNVVLSIIGGIILAIIPIGVLFKLMFWPGAMAQLTVAIILTPLLLILIYVMYSKSPLELIVYYKNYLIRIIFWLIMCIVFYGVTKRQLIKIQHSDNPQLMNLKINAYENPENVEYGEALENYYMQQDSLFLINEKSD